MKQDIIVTTDFSLSSRNALTYACKHLKENESNILLLYIYTVPAGLSSDGVTMAAISDVYSAAEEQLETELAWVKEFFPAVHITSRVAVGGLVESLTEYIEELDAKMVVMGAVNNYDDLMMWDNEMLSTLTDLAVPVFVIPPQVSYAPVKNIAFSTDYRKLCTPGQIDFIKWFALQTNAQLHIVHVARIAPDNETIRKQNEEALQEVLSDLSPRFYAIEDPHVIDSIVHFVNENKIDVLIVIPRKHGVWDSILHPSHTRQLARLNHLPILALHD